MEPSGIPPRIRILVVAALIVVSFTAYQVFAATTVGINFSTDGNLTINGNTALGDTTSDTTTMQGQTTITTLATGLLNVLTGNLKVGNGTPTVTLDGEDAYVEGTLEVDGAARFDGVVTINSIANNIVPQTAPTATLRSITSPDTTGNVGLNTSFALDSSGYPVVAYTTPAAGTDIKIMHCNDVNCAGGNESINAISSTRDAEGLSLALDTNGFPVVSYQEGDADDLKVIHCNDVNCANGDDSNVTVDSTGQVGQFTSLKLDASNYPVISYYDLTNTNLKLVHCNDINCVGGNEFINTLMGPDDEGKYSSLVLDGSGFPVISYYEDEVGDDSLKMVHCNDVNCAGSDENINTVSWLNSGQYTSMALDSLGYPVISHHDPTNFDLKVTHCSDVNCAGSKTTTTVDSTGTVGQYTSLVLDASGFPVISYYDVTNADLKVMHCNDANCAGANETTTSLDSTGTVGQYTSLRLDSSGYPVISYHDGTNLDLKVARCIDANCASSATYSNGSNLGSSGTYFNSIYGANYYGKSTTVSSFDLAETYAVHNTSIEAGDIVAVAVDQGGFAETGNVNTKPFIEKSSASNQKGLLGVISTQPGIILSNWDDKSDPSRERHVAIVGRVPVKVSDENGAIKPGDPITSSSKAGVGMKSTGDGKEIGFALEALNSKEGKILIYLSP